jgi:hypothetical protein
LIPDVVASGRSGVCTVLDRSVDGRTLQPSRAGEVEEEQVRSILGTDGPDPGDRLGGGTAGNASHTSRGRLAVPCSLRECRDGFPNGWTLSPSKHSYVVPSMGICGLSHLPVCEARKPAPLGHLPKGREKRPTHRLQRPRLQMGQVAPYSVPWRMRGSTGFGRPGSHQPISFRLLARPLEPDQPP